MDVNQVEIRNRMYAMLDVQFADPVRDGYHVLMWMGQLVNVLINEERHQPHPNAIVHAIRGVQLALFGELVARYNLPYNACLVEICSRAYMLRNGTPSMPQGVHALQGLCGRTDAATLPVRAIAEIIRSASMRRTASRELLVHACIYGIDLTALHISRVVDAMGAANARR